MTSRLFNLVSDHTFPSPQTGASVSSYASSLIKAVSTERNTTKEVLNCVRILQRLLPVIFEVEGESIAFELETLWKRAEVEHDDVLRAEGPQFVIEDEDDQSEHGEATSFQSTESKPKARKTLPSLGEKLFSCINDLLFCCGFTLPAKIQVDHYKINYVIW